MSNARDKANIPALNFSSTGIDDNATSTAITIDSSERVGIGTSPKANAKFHIRTSNDRNLYVRDGYRTTGGIAIQTVNNAENANVPLEINADAETLTLSGTPITFTNSGSERMRIDSSGRVGIGTSSPSAPLQVNGTARASNFNTLSTQVVMSNNSKDWDISSVIGTIATVDSSISFELTMRERNAASVQLFRIYYIRVGTGTTFNISSAIWSVGSTSANTTISYPSAGIIRFTNSSFSVLDAQIRRISA